MSEEETSLFPVVDIPEVEEEEEEYDIEYRPSVSWDFERGDFVVDAKHRMLKSDGYEAYKTWCIKMAQTERETCLAYDEDDGTELESALREEDEDAIESAIEETIEEALLVNPRTESVENFEFSWEKDTVHVKFDVVPVGWEEFELELTIENGRGGEGDAARIYST